MKKNILLFLTTLILWSCGTTKQKSYPDYVLGITEKPSKKIFSLDSLNIVTPSIEIYKRIDNTTHRKYDDREIVKDFITTTLKAELNKTEHYELNLMSADYLTVNRVLESITYTKFKNPEWIIKAPEEILITDKKYTLLINMTVIYGEANNGVIYFCVINNQDKVLEYVDRYNFKGSPLNNKRLKKRIQKGISKITNT